MIWCQTLNWIYISTVNDVNLCQDQENMSLRHTNLKLLNLFLILIPGWWTDVNRNSLVEGGPWWIPHRWHETQNKVLEFWVWCNHRTGSKGTDTKVVFTAEVNLQFDFPLNIRQNDRILGSMTKWDKHTVRQWTIHSFERLKGVTWLHESGSSWTLTEYPTD